VFQVFKMYLLTLLQTLKNISLAVIYRAFCVLQHFNIENLFTHRRSIVECGGCFQRRLFVCLSVCLFVCLHDNFWTIKCRM